MKTLAISLLSVFFLLGCGTEIDSEKGGIHTNTQNPEAQKAQLLDQIENLEGKVFDENMGIQKDAASSLLLAYIDFSNKYYEDERRCNFTLKAAQLAQGLRKFNQAIQLYQNVSSDCQNHELHEEAYFMIAVIYDDFLNDREQAKKYYENFIADYPNHHLATDAQARIDMLYLTDEQIIERFRSLNKQQ